MNKLFSNNKPCGTCPYRKDAPRRLWARDEFEDLLANENSELGTVYLCHKKNGCVCVGWLIEQDRRGLPSIALRLALLRHGIDRHYLDSLDSTARLFNNIEEMVRANFPDALLKFQRNNNRPEEE